MSSFLVFAPSWETFTHVVTPTSVMDKHCKIRYNSRENLFLFLYSVIKLSIFIYLVLATNFELRNENVKSEENSGLRSPKPQQRYQPGPLPSPRPLQHREFSRPPRPQMILHSLEAKTKHGHHDACFFYPSEASGK